VDTLGRHFTICAQSTDCIQQRPYHGDITNVNKNLLFIAKYKAGFRPYPNGTVHQLHQLALKLSSGAEVICESKYLNIFQHVYARFWSCEDDNPPPPIITKPLLYIHDKKRGSNTDCYSLPQRGYLTIPNPELLILADSTWYFR
jgi:hypothetical protein